MTYFGSETGEDGFFHGTIGRAMLGVAYVVAGVVLFSGLVVDSTTLFGAGLVGVSGLVVLSLVLVYRDEGVVTAENKLIGGFVTVAIGFMIGLYSLTELRSEVVIGVVIVVGVLIPGVLLQYTDYGRAD